VLAALGGAATASAQAVKILAPKTPLHKDARPNSSLVAEVDAGTELALDFRKPTRVKLKLQKEKELQNAPAGWTVPPREQQVNVLALLPSKESDGLWWLRVQAPNGKPAWVQRDAVELTPGRIRFDPPLPIFIPLRQEEVPRLIQATFPPVHIYALRRGGLTVSSLDVLFVIGPDGKTRAAALVRSSGMTSADAAVLDATRSFVFDPSPAASPSSHVVVVLQLEFAVSGPGSSVLVP
jgi:hypothetical protein